MALWNNDTEIQFFTEALKNFASPEQIFYKLKGGYFAYIPRGAGSEGQTLQARNSLIGQFTEKWCKTLFQPIATKLGLYAVNSVVCEELGLSSRTNADLALCTTNENNQRPENIKLIFEASNEGKLEGSGQQHINAQLGEMPHLIDMRRHRGAGRMRANHDPRHEQSEHRSQPKMFEQRYADRCCAQQQYRGEKKAFEFH